MDYFGMDNIGKMIKEARERRRLTQEELAIIVNKKRSYISRIEKDSSNLNLKTLKEIIEVGLGGKIIIKL